jgi:Gram-negative bacterial tonB protein.
VRILRGLHPLLDEEAVRVIESAPQLWEPAWDKKGEPTDVTYTFPVIFNLTEEVRVDYPIRGTVRYLR